MVRNHPCTSHSPFRTTGAFTYRPKSFSVSRRMPGKCIARSPVSSWRYPWCVVRRAPYASRRCSVASLCAPPRLLPYAAARGPVPTASRMPPQHSPSRGKGRGSQAQSLQGCCRRSLGLNCTKNVRQRRRSHITSPSLNKWSYVATASSMSGSSCFSSAHFLHPPTFYGFWAHFLRCSGQDCTTFHALARLAVFLLASCHLDWKR